MVTLFIVDHKSLSSLSTTGGSQVHRQVQQTAKSEEDPGDCQPAPAGQNRPMVPTCTMDVNVCQNDAEAGGHQ